MIDEHAREFAGKAVAEWTEETGIADPENTIYRIALDWDASEEGALWTDSFAAFLEDPRVSEITGLIVGSWGGMGDDDDPPNDIVEALVAARDRLPNLTALFFGDIISEECEISWIVQADVSPLFAAYPRLEHFRVRGGNGLRFGALRHENLKTLIIETGGLPVALLREVASAHLPVLEHLELWLGEENYGWDGSLDDVSPLWEEGRFPALRSLGLRDSEIADEIAVAISRAPLLLRLEALDLSLGTLSDEGGTALLTSPYVRHLKKLDLHHHFLSEEMVARLTGVPAESGKSQPPLENMEPSLLRSPGLGIEVDVSDPQKEDEYNGERHRYVAVGE